MNFTRQLLVILILAAALVVGDFCIEILAPDVTDWLKKEVGETGYQNRLWVILFIAVVAGLLIGDWQKWFKKEPTTKAFAEDLAPSIQEELIANLKKKYKKRFEERKLAGRCPVNLRINASRTGTSEETAQNFITLQDGQVGHEIGEIFDRALGRLLVVGLPGAGKTTLLLQLAAELLKQAGTAKRPIPVLLNLATWRSEFTTFDEWLKRVLPNELGASKALAEKIRANIPLVLLLDGLDEVPEEDRNSCLKALGQYGMDDKNQYALSTRITEYEATIDVRNLKGQVEVAPLDAKQIEMNLAAQSGAGFAGASELYRAIQKDSLLKQCLENPFYLNTAQLLFASGKNWSEFGFVATDVAGRQEELVEQFVEYALEHKVKREYPAEKVEKWMAFFASRMEEEKLRVFELVDFQPWWIQKKLAYKIFDSLITASLGFLFALLLGALIRDFWLGLFLGCFWFLIIFGAKVITNCLHNLQKITTSENWIWSWTLFFQSLKILFFTFLFIGFSLEISLFILPYINLDAMPIWPREYHFGFGLYLAGIISLIGGISKFIYDGDWFLQKKFLNINDPYTRFYASFLRFRVPLFQHLILRILICIESSLPLRLVHFLNEMSRRHLLEFDGDLDTETGGGSWRWRHRIIQEWFLRKEE